MKGYDMFFTNTDSKDGMRCKICGQSCEVDRGVNGPTSFGGAMKGIDRLHDRFTCPNHGEPWHEQALDLFMAIEKHPSPSIKRIMEGDLKKIIKKKKVMI